MDGYDATPSDEQSLFHKFQFNLRKVESDVVDTRYHLETRELASQDKND